MYQVYMCHVIFNMNAFNYVEMITQVVTSVNHLATMGLVKPLVWFDSHPYDINSYCFGPVHTGFVLAFNGPHL